MKNAWTKRLLFVGLIGVSVICVALVITLASRGGVGKPSKCPAPPKAETDSVSAKPRPTTFTTPSSSPEFPEGPWSNPRLPRNVLPDHYDLLLHPDIEEGTFRGEVTIHLTIVNETDVLLVHAWQLTVDAVSVESPPTTGVVSVADSFLFPQNEYFVVKLTAPIQPGNASLTLSFAGPLTGRIVGFYRSSYKQGNETRFLATSKFQPTYARRAFPCLDEPGFKSTYSVRLVHQPHMMALSNMDPQETQPYANQSDLVVTSFHQSVPMVTYLACFIVCEFNFTSKKMEDGKEFRVLARPDQVEWTRFALDVGVKVQERYAQYFGIHYPLPKQDMIAIPDFPSGAMEHWGLITYRETALLVDPEKDGADTVERVAKTIAHEITHQWFGNLVTMTWWDDLWLNEGFATFFAYRGLDWTFPDWQPTASLVVQETQLAFSLDDKDTSHPIVQHVEHPDQITEIFDRISYSKGAAILHMLESFLTPEVFQRGVRTFLEMHEFGHATTDDLWKALTKEAKNVDVKKVMDTWTLQMGYPVVHVHRHAHPHMSHATVSQTRFLRDPNATANSTSPFGYSWEIPLSYRTSRSREVHHTWMHLNNQTIKFDVPDVTPGDWVKFNADEQGFYRVNYEEDGWRQLSDALGEDPLSFSIMDRANLVDDAFSLASAGLVTYDIPLNLSRYLHKERDYAPWAAARGQFGALFNLLYTTDLFGSIREHTLTLLAPVIKDLGWTDTGNHTTKKLRRAVLMLACSLEEPEALENASTLLTQWLKLHEPVSPNLLSVALVGGIKLLGPPVWERLWQRYLVEESAQQRSTLMGSLTSARTPWLLNRLLSAMMDETKIRSQDALQVLALVSSNPVGRPLAWRFLRESWPQLVSRFTLNDRYLGNVVAHVTSAFTTETELDEVKAFFARYPEAGAGARARQRALSTISANIAWWKRSEASLRIALQQISTETDTSDVHEGR